LAGGSIGNVVAVRQVMEKLPTVATSVTRLLAPSGAAASWELVQSAGGRLKQLDEITRRICDPPGPVTISLRNSTRAARSRATSANAGSRAHPSGRARRALLGMRANVPSVRRVITSRQRRQAMLPPAPVAGRP